MNVNKIRRTGFYTTFFFLHWVSLLVIFFKIPFWKTMDPDTLMFGFNASTATKIEDSDNAMIQMALKQVENTLKELGIRASQGYALGYELGYIKGVLEHVLKIVPESVNKEAYMKGYVSGYIQGMLYSFNQGQMQRGNPDNTQN